MILVKKRWTRKPLTPAKLKESLKQSCVLFANASNATFDDLLAHRTPIKVGIAPKRIVTALGEATEFNGSSGNPSYIEYKNSTAMNDGGAKTVIACIRAEGSLTANAGIITKFEGVDGTWRTWALYRNHQTVPVNTIGFSISKAGSGDVLSVNTTDALVSGQFYIVAARYIPSTEISVWIDGVKKATNTTSIHSNLFVTSACPVRIATQYDKDNVGAAYGSNEPILFAGVWNRAFSNAELASLTSIGDFYEPQTLYIPTQTGAGSQTLTPSLFENTSEFYAHTVTPGAVTLTPSLFTSTTADWYGPTVTATYTLTPSLFTSSTANFYAPTVTPGAVTLTPSLFTSTTADFYQATVTTPSLQTLTPTLFTSATADFYPAIVSVRGTGVVDVQLNHGSGAAKKVAPKMLPQRKKVDDTQDIEDISLIVLEAIKWLH